MSRQPIFYSCMRCPAYCCSYPRIVVDKRDLRRLAKHFGLSEEAAWKKFTKRGHTARERVLRHKSDEIFGTVCRFLDSETRMCTAHEARPKICREYPGAVRCGYYDFLCAERRSQDDPEYIATTYND